MITEEDNDSLQDETLYLLSNSINSKRIKESIKQAQEEKFKPVDLNENS